jgi:hypothetical protein
MVININIFVVVIGWFIAGMVGWQMRIEQEKIDEQEKRFDREENIVR